MQGRPSDTEYASFYAGYVALVPEPDILAALEAQASQLRALARDLPPDRHSHRYAAGKWSVKEVVGHLGDAERVFGYRATCISRGDRTPLPSFDENLYVERAPFDRDAFQGLVDEWLHLRAANLAMLRRLDEAAWQQVGTANAKSISVRALAYIMVGHVRHHLSILRERYGVTV